MKNIFSPSALSADFGHLAEELEITEKAGAACVHLDVMDGVFVPQISFGMPVIRSIRPQCDLIFDVHLMIVDPIRYIRDFADCGADILTFHIEAVKDEAGVREVIDAIHGAGKKAGLSVKPGTPLSAAVPFFSQIDLLLIMTVEPGFGGQKFMADMVPKIEEARRIRDEQGLDFDIEVDGGIKKDNIDVVLDAGANMIVAGSAAYNDRTEESIRWFTGHLAERE